MYYLKSEDDPILLMMSGLSILILPTLKAYKHGILDPISV
jgi:hypothetical protein